MLPACSAPAIRGEHLGSWGGVVRTGRRRVGPTRCANCGDEACRPALWPQIVVRYHRRRDMELSCCKRGQVLVAPGAWRPPVHGGGLGRSRSRHAVEKPYINFLREVPGLRRHELSR